MKRILRLKDGDVAGFAWNPEEEILEIHDSVEDLNMSRLEDRAPLIQARMTLEERQRLAQLLVYTGPDTQ